MAVKKPLKVSPKKADLKKKLNKMLETPASFEFFIAIHDFIEVIETDASLSAKVSKDLKYGHLKRIHRGIKDVSIISQRDLGHERYMVINDLNRIQEKEFSESNAFWKKRELFRKLAVEIYERLSPSPVSPKK